MVKCCCVPGCANTLKTPGISFHRCPKDESRKKQWMITLRRDGKRNRPVSSTMYVCSFHFTPSDFREVINGSNKCLKKEAFPTIFEPSSPEPGTSVGLAYDFQAQSSSMTNIGLESSYVVREERVELPPELASNATSRVKSEPTVDPLAMSPRSSEPDSYGIKTEPLDSSQAALGADGLPAFERVDTYDSNAFIRTREEADVTHPTSGNSNGDVTTQLVVNSLALPAGNVTIGSEVVPTFGPAPPAYFYVFNGVDYQLQLLPAQYLKCSDCDEYFTSDSLLQDHRTAKHVDSPYSCDACNLSFASRALLDEHSRVCELSVDERSDGKTRSNWKHRCGVCGARFDRASALDVHCRGHAGDSEQNAAATGDRRDAGNAVVLTCEPDLDISDMGREHETADYILPHSFDEHGGATVAVTTSPSPAYSILPTSTDVTNKTDDICGVNADFCRIVDDQYQCVKCRQKFPNDIRFKAHNCRGIKKSFICGVCKNSYPNENSLIGHSWSHSAYYCGICRKMCASLKDKLDHMLLFHPCDHDHSTCWTAGGGACAGSVGT